MEFEIKLPLFEGPFDLLLFFIERDELDIYDIPIFKITNDFLDYIRHLEKLNMEIASEFIWVAGTLIRIKAKMLIPRPEIDAQGNELDPRDELIKHLLEYKKYRSVLGEFIKMEDKRLQQETRGNVLKEIKKISAVNNVEAELQHLDLYKLLKVYERVIERFKITNREGIHTIMQYPYSMETQKKILLSNIQNKKRVSFEEVIELNTTRIVVVYNFLAILEMLQSGEISIQVGIGYNNFWIEAYNPEEVASELAITAL
jgi:segregation and condensation protein A